MFKDYKIPIAFLILVLIIILGVKAQAQNIILFDDDDYTGFWTPANLPIDTTSTSVYFYGEAPKTKVAKDSGGVSVKPYMRVWTDSTAIVNSTFNANINGWHGWVGNDSLKWVASGGGFTGAIMAFTLGGFVSFMTDTMSLLAGSYHLAADLFYEADVSDTYFYGLLRLNDTSLTYFEQGVGGRTGTIIIDEVVEITAGNYVLTFFTSSADTMRMYGDNITLTNTADSTYGYTYTIPRPSDTTTFYYSQSVWWRQKDKDTIWLAAETDTVTVYPYIEPQPDNINYMRTVDGDTMFTAEGDTMKTSYNYNFNKTNGEKNEEDIILPQRVYAVLDSKRTMGFTV